ncbi:unnamed protein product [Cyclocybe aegerita]|uniref:Uncharacterized protein n=1 Tax=Cyclocybe aegerita TaxID=1973307 RepID=A0A8S0VV17_CYCAE|nr:unnamed protein product [Cyclocybe aegerita]
MDARTHKKDDSGSKISTEAGPPGAGTPTGAEGVSAPVDWTALIADDLPRPFDVVSSDLAALGALSIEDFLSNTATSTAAMDVAFYVQLPEPPPSPEKEKQTDEEKAEGEDDAVSEEAKEKDKERESWKGMLTSLLHASHRVFGSGDCLKFEYLEEDPKSKQCILTITRPNGATRSYKSESGFSRRGGAKAQAAKIAVDMGAIDFIMSGDSDALKAKKGLLLNPFDVEIDNMDSTEALPGMPKYTPEEEPLKIIEECCTEWRADKGRTSSGPTLVDPIHSNNRAAKLACARSAIEEGVIDFIKYGNGQTEPPKPIDDGLDENHNVAREYTPPPPPKGITLQEFYETLPRPFPEDVGDSSANEINAPGWLNVILQSARGGRLVSAFTPVVDTARHLHGCILRVQRPSETRTYLVDPQFPKRSDAKSAVCLLGMSQGLGDYIRGLKEEAENKLPPDRRKLANEKLLQVTAAECGKVRPGNRPAFSYTSERDAFGCTLKVDISANSAEPDVREYSVGTEYRTKADAKAAVVCLAAEQGLIDLLRFRGAPPPADYVPFWEAQVNGDGDNYIAKRKEPERDVDGEGRDRKKRRKGVKDGATELGEVGDVKPNVNGLRVGGKSLPDIPSSLPRKPNFVPNFNPSTNSASGGSYRGGNNNNSGFKSNQHWKKPPATGSSGLGPPNAYASGPRTGGEGRAGNRTGSSSYHPPSPDHPSAHRPPAGGQKDYYPPPSSSSSGHVSSSSYPPYDDRAGYGSAPYHSGSSYSQHPEHSYPQRYDSYPPYSQADSSYYGPDPGPTYSQPPGPSYPPPSGPSYPPPDPYGHSYPAYPPPSQYPNPPYHAAPAPPSHHYPAYYPPAPSAPPTPPHTSYYSYPSQQYYPNGAYPPNYEYQPPPPVPYSSPPPPPPAPAPVAYHSLGAPPGQYSPRFRSPRSPRSPPHAPDYPPYREPPYDSHDVNWSANHRRRHTTMGDSHPQGRLHGGHHDNRQHNGYERTQEGGGNRRHPDSNQHPGSTNANGNYNSQGRRFQERRRMSEGVRAPHPSRGPNSNQNGPGPQQGEESVKEESIEEPLIVLPPSGPTSGTASRDNGQPTSKSNLDILFEFCRKEGLPKPRFMCEQVEDKDGAKKYKVWAEKDDQRLELQTLFSSFEEGQERLSKRVLQWERSKMKQRT